MIFVTGGTGLVGSRLLANLIIDSSSEIIALKRSHSDLSLVKKTFSSRFQNHEELFSKIRWVNGDIEDFFQIEDLLEPGCEVYHTAAMVSFQPNQKSQLMRINVDATANLVDACLRKSVKKLCYVSSIAALGRSSNASEAITELDYRSSAKGSSDYSASKYNAETEVWRGIAEGLNAVIINPSVIIGAGNWSSGSSELITTVYRGLKFYTNGINGYVDVDDVARALILLMKSDVSAQRYILSAENWTYEKLFKTIATKLNVKGPKLYASPVLGSIAWRLLAVISFFSGKTPLITKDTARNAKAVFRYSSKKFIDETDFIFKPIELAIEDACRQFKIDNQD